AWCFYTPLEGAKLFRSKKNCCLSSGPRGVALLPSIICSGVADGAAVNLFTTSHVVVPQKTGTSIEIEQTTNYPFDGDIELTITPRLKNPNGEEEESSYQFPLFLRLPEFAAENDEARHAVARGIKINDQPLEHAEFLN